MDKAPCRRRHRPSPFQILARWILHSAWTNQDNAKRNCCSRHAQLLPEDVGLRFGVRRGPGRETATLVIFRGFHRVLVPLLPFEQSTRFNRKSSRRTCNSDSRTSHLSLRSQIINPPTRRSTQICCGSSFTPISMTFSDSRRP